MRDDNTLYALDGYVDTVQKKYRGIVRAAVSLWAAARHLSGHAPSYRQALDDFCSEERAGQDLIVAAMLKGLLPAPAVLRRTQEESK